MLEKIETRKVLGCVESRIGGRPENQDSYGFKDMSWGTILTVCDGMGGGPAGKLASSIAIDTLLDFLEEVDIAKGLEQIAYEAIIKANNAVYRKACTDSQLHGMGSTCTLLLLGEDYAVAAHVGDSRIYQLRGEKIKFRTFDHSMVFELVKKKVITEEQARQSAQSNIITRALGVRAEVEPEINILKYRKGDVFVLSSDGIHGTMPEKELIEWITSQEYETEQKVAMLTEHIDNLGKRKGGGHDNMTVMMVGVTESKAKNGLLGRIADLLSRLFVVLASLSFLLTGMAQIPIWKEHLAEVQWEHCYGSIFKKKSLGMTRLFDMERGKCITVSYDSITNFSDGYALAMKQENESWRIVSLINRNTMTEILPTKPLYATSIPYFSEGMVAVANNKGYKGYMNVNGDLVIKCSYTKAFPFYEGKAMVVQKKKSSNKYIDNRGKTVKMTGRDENAVKEVVCQWDKTPSDEGWSLYTTKGKYGYKYNGQIVIPAQFDNAEDIRLGNAAVRIGEQYGIIKILPYNLNACFVKSGNTEICTITYTSGIDPTKLKVHVLFNGQYFEIFPQSSSTTQRLTCYFTEAQLANEFWVNIYYDDLLVKRLHHEKPAKEVEKKVSTTAGKVFVTSFGKKGKRANVNDIEYIEATIKNTTMNPQTVKATIYVDGTPYTQTIKIKARRSTTVTAKVKVKKERFAKVYVKLSNGYTTGVKHIQLKPFY